ncbi:MAG: hypothetical protein AB1847_19020 [bacterium]
MFTDTLELKFTLTAGGKNFKIPAGDIKAFTMDLHPYGFTCQVNFWVSNEQKADDLFPFFVRPDLIRANLEVVSYYNPMHLALEALKLQGLVMQKSILNERTIENVNLQQDPVIYRYYQITFADPASVLWRQHFPCDLLTDKTVKDLLDAHKGSEVTLKYDWDALDKQFAINTLALGVEANQASFYDFVLWFVSTMDGVLTYDCNENTYTLSKTKKEDGQPAELAELDVESLQIEFPETIRHSADLLNACSEDPRREPVEQSQAVSGVRHDYIGRFVISSDFADRKNLESQRLKVREHELYAVFRNFPLIPYRPGCLIELAKEGWSKKLFAQGKVYRIRDISFAANAAQREVTAGHNLPYGKFDIDMKSRLELKSEKWTDLPQFQLPLFPLCVEGRIKSEIGEDNENTYQIYQDRETSLDQYRVIIPLFDNQEVVVPFAPDFLMGHFYFPVYKNARVLVAIGFHSARIEQFLDWGPGARLPMDTQGNHIFLGKWKDAKNQTSINHVYVDEKPVLNVKRTSEVDTQMVKLEEGRLVMEVKEEEQ